MIRIDIDPIIFSLGPFSVRWYGLMYAVGITVAALVVWPYFKARGVTSAQMERILYWTIPAGLVGARLYFVLQQPLLPYLEQPWRILAFWEGGMAFYGAVFAVVLTMVLLALRMKVSPWKLLDGMAIFGAVGQFFGRIGNIINGDVVGYPTTLPWGFVYTNPNSFVADHTIAYQPAAVYEAIVDILLFVILWSLRKKVQPGILFFIYIFGYAVSQIVVFFWRDNEVLLLGLKQAQLTAIGVIIVAAGVFVWYRRGPPNGQTEEKPVATDDKPAQ